MNIKALINNISTQLLKIYDYKQAQVTAWWILNWLTGYNQAQLLSKKNITLTKEQITKLEDIINKHVNKNMPLQYIFGSVCFLGLEITVRAPVLIPRPETEFWCAELIEQLKQVKNQDLKILDLCTGSACIALALANAFKESFVYAVDISDDACLLAQENAQKNNIKNIEIIKSDLYKNLNLLRNIKFDLIVSNPPYISYKQWQKLDPMVKKWEDSKALMAKNHGLEIIKQIINQAPDYLKYNKELEKYNIPQVVIEIDETQAEKIKEIFKSAGFKNIKIKKDLSGKDRVVTARL